MPCSGFKSFYHFIACTSFIQIRKAGVHTGKLAQFSFIHSFIHSSDSCVGSLNTGVSSERINEVEKCFEEAGLMFQLRAVTVVFVQDGDCRPLDQLPAGARKKHI